MDMNAWEEILRKNVNMVLNGSTEPVNDTGILRPWPPVMIRDFLGDSHVRAREVDASITVGDIADWLSESPGASIAVYDNHKRFLGIAVDEDVMALIKRDGVRALDYPIAEAVQRNRPVCSVTDSPYVILEMMQSAGWDRVGVAERGDVIAILHRRELVKFVSV